MNYVSGNMIKELREKKHLTQKVLAELLQVSDKTISKWETERGLPDISLIGGLSSALGVSVAELLAGEYSINNNRHANMKNVKFYVCPVCGNIVQSVGAGDYNCCGVKLIAAEPEEQNGEHLLQCEMIDSELYLHMDHPMEKEHYISFAAYVTSDSVNLIKLYPEQNVQCRFAKRGHGFIYAFCNRHGLFRIVV